jgi:hypothetical protein
MANLHFKGTIVEAKRKHTFELALFSFQDDGSKIIYSPALDLSGYGKTEAEARESFAEALREFVHYTSNKRTIIKELRRLGWAVSASTIKKHKPAKAPELARMLQANEYLATIFETKNFKKYNESVALPLA